MIILVDVNKFCICCGLDIGLFMINCDECCEWYYRFCVNLVYYLCFRCDVNG